MAGRDSPLKREVMCCYSISAGALSMKLVLVRMSNTIVHIVLVRVTLNLLKDQCRTDGYIYVIDILLDVFLFKGGDLLHRHLS